ncbi:endonuclease reverse transcriptase [Lasius niger]|uniref:Endonuclease reverse transcriptase n=1 Tax=Lasius niger TaxID=67767 RepID=A0A0J7K6S1_LASNI|nr:endonuclease reverse transcriptase [Lasius niger]
MHRKWNAKKLDKDFLRAALIWKGHESEVEERNNVEQMTTWLDQIMEEAWDAAAPRIGPKKPRRQAYWWQESVAALRHECIRARRSWQRARKKKRPKGTVVELGAEYKQKRKDLRMEIAKQKSLAWQDLINSIDED